MFFGPLGARRVDVIETGFSKDDSGRDVTRFRNLWREGRQWQRRDSAVIAA
jgi:hypothetical protein